MDTSVSEAASQLSDSSVAQSTEATSKWLVSAPLGGDTAAAAMLSLPDGGGGRQLLNVDDIMNVVYSYRCRFCSFAADSSSEVTLHVVSHHLTRHAAEVESAAEVDMVTVAESVTAAEVDSTAAADSADDTVPLADTVVTDDAMTADGAISAANTVLADVAIADEARARETIADISVIDIAVVDVANGANIGRTLSVAKQPAVNHMVTVGTDPQPVALEGAAGPDVSDGVDVAVLVAEPVLPMQG